jgi:biotin-dependent carboxylase-like uncharacterized protein
MGTIRVLEAGLLTTVQDAAGRPGLGRFGVPPGGAVDAGAARLANRLVGNRGDEPLLEITLAGPVLAWETAGHLGLAGADLGAVSEHQRLSPGHSHRLPAGAILRFEGRRQGARAYLAVEGGFDVDRVLGSASTDRRSSFGGFHGRPLQAGDLLGTVGDASGHLRSVTTSPDLPGPAVALRFVATGGDPGWFGHDAVAAFVTAAWTVGPASDRNGIRLIGGRIDTAGTIASLGVPVGSIQVPPSGEPIVTLADGPVTGGYPVLGVVARADHDRLAQLAPGAAVRFEAIDIAEARSLVSQEPQVELDPGDVGAGWAG